MKLLSGLFLFWLLGMPFIASASEPQAQADLLLVKIATALENDRISEALSACATLEKLGPSLKKPLPESFYYNYIVTLQRSGGKESVLRRIYAYRQRFGKDGAHYPQVAALFSELQQAAAGNVDADAAISDWKEANCRENESAHEQRLQTLRACQAEAIALEQGEQELSQTFVAITTQSEALVARKGVLDQRILQINASGPGKTAEQKQLRIDFNGDSQAYNEAVRDFNNSGTLYAAKEEEQSRRNQGYEERCGNLTIIQYELDEVCAGSADRFCRGFE